jgi:hypothetical protein
VAFSKSPDSSVQHREHTLKYNSNQRFPNGIHSQSKSFILKKLHLAVPGAPAEMARLIFDYKGNVPFSLALGVNAVLFSAAKSKLFTMLTPTGFAHAMALGTLLWTTLGWRGWTYCVLYLLLGNLVTKVKFAEKSKRGLAEGRGGRRGPENVWYVAKRKQMGLSQKARLTLPCAKGDPLPQVLPAPYAPSKAIFFLESARKCSCLDTWLRLQQSSLIPSHRKLEKRMGRRRS